MKNLKTYLLLGLFFYISSCFSQNVEYKGMPFIRNFTPKEYHADPQNWAIVQDQRGVMYFGNNKGVLEFDGENWKLYSTPNHSCVRSLAIDSTGTIYVGAFNELGYMASDSSGKLTYVSLIDKLNKKDRKFNDVWKICVTTHGIFFLTIDKIFKLHNNKFTVFNVKLLASLGFVADNHLFLVQEDRGLFVFENDTIVRLPRTSKMYVDFVIPYIDKKIIIYNSRDFYIYNLALIDKNLKTKHYNDNDYPKSIIKKFKIKVGNYIRKNGLYSYAKINDNSFVVGTTRGGIIEFDKKGDFVQVINKKSGLQNNTVLSLYVDNRNNLWAALDNGISYLQINSPITRFTTLNNIEGSILALTRYKNRIYFSTTHGVFYLPEFNLKNANKKYSILKVANTNFAFWDFIKIKGRFLAGGDYGLVQINDTIAEDIVATNQIYCMGTSKKFPNHLFLGLTAGFMSLEIDTNNKDKNIKFTNRHNFNEISDPIRNIANDSLGNLWLTSEFNGVYRIDFFSDDVTKYKISHYDTSDGLPQLDYNNVYKIKNNIVFATSKGFYKPIINNDTNEKQSKFIRDPAFQQCTNPIRVNQVEIDNKNKIWANTDYSFGSFQKDSNSKFIFNDTIFKKISSAYVFYLDTTDIIWIGSIDEELYRYDNNVKRNFHIPFRALIRNVIISSDSTIFNGTYYNDTIKKGKYFTQVSLNQSSKLIPIIKHKYKVIKFSFSSTFYENAKKIRYKYKLEGFDEKWSSWTEQTKKEYTNLPSGEYTFVVKAKNYYGIESIPASFKFSVLPPWYQTVWAYIFYLIFFIFVLRIILKINSKRLVASNLRLEEIVKQRTSELRQQKEELQSNSELLSSFNKELKKKNHLITDSLSYAKRIQDATLPSLKTMKKYLPHSFVFFKPRDIVSGDFYWYSKQQDKIIIAVVDSTGHGVPGAFMSMIGNTLLNEIVINDKVNTPATILERLNIGIIKALNQEVETDDVQSDGMNISICCIDKKNKKIEIANADQMAYLISNDEVTAIAGDIFSVGGNFSQKVEVCFTNRIFDIKDGAMLYLFSDGYQDQFGGNNNKKFMASNFKQLLINISKLDITQQLHSINDTFVKWKGNTRQIDDVLVIGIRLDF